MVRSRAPSPARDPVCGQERCDTRQADHDQGRHDPDRQVALIGAIVSYLNVITVQTIDLTDEVTAIQIRGRRMAAAVLLVQALGGGWTAAELP